ncbi:16S rRNA (guanine(966)-N(2))-methyltransferase RsmD [Weissella confusa]|uniref:16S rRNA (Guanine(966)-N(2))-methyltransferase RsmD n=1 Tax=Weissella confusa TaxID=1583 RepID=A0A4Z0RJG2_WEICO|nr:16S rRNA (guanine(966)-N(2))-methyltransferase RsmD [Weissella confusa]MBJ7615907.1 16S rRNA (guanine(966)-N(2))-methyltransferase RsmD [Weissella confusa]MBJ7626181.1 16S rRNA (guanine(966)-N(2))-methyltransferase RsmD [Weissella confusa]MBJ7631915.1 16S rRNA (guanine(966)-N(2))-methyltransferase RsmD [Weissella confusa]MBJ7639143.1 16S rRNA (guanine(966)-N(2))-methyltransferase RsmD [Weissella confusa]MBJ7644693.1 16S rRNA (guanine(966)-N(2))-methyltransferase RsmD [Weissella confusa]
MRIVSGEFGGRPLKAVPGDATRPTTDKVKEAIFSMIGPYFDGGRSLDLYAGSGGLSIEGVSRGLDEAVLVDRQFAAIKTINDNIAITKTPEKFTVIKSTADAAIQRLMGSQPFDVLYFDPPYAKQTIVADLEKLLAANLIAPEALIVAETDQNANLPEDLPNFEFLKEKDYGITVVKLYQYKGEA